MNGFVVVPVISISSPNASVRNVASCAAEPLVSIRVFDERSKPWKLLVPDRRWLVSPPQLPGPSV
jgi:hypothetical protein